MKFRRPAIVALLLALAGAVAGCAGDGAATGTGNGAASPVRRDPTLPSYEDIAFRYNQRATRLSRVWARAVVSVRFTDAEGRRKSEQGEGHFQFVHPARLALSVGKVGEVLMYVGCDERRHWLFERGDADRASVGLNANVGRACADSLGIPASPSEMIDLLGLTPLPPGRGEGAIFRATDKSRSLVAVVTRPNARLRLTLDPVSLEPSRIELLAPDAPADAPSFLAADLSEYANLNLRGVGGFFHRIPGRIAITNAENDAEIRISLADPADRAPAGAIDPRAFDFDYLLDVLGPGQVLVLDAECPTSALAQP